MMKNRAFSLIELMIVITIIGILAAVAVPAYSDYVTRAKMVNAITFLQSYKNPAIEMFYQTGAAPYNTTLQGSTPLPWQTAVPVTGIGTAVFDTFQTNVVTGIRLSLDASLGAGSGPIYLVFKVDGNNLTVACGYWTGVSDANVIKYLPEGCKVDGSAL